MRMRYDHVVWASAVFFAIAQCQVSLDFVTRSPNCPRSDSALAIGYYNGKISLIGGYRNTRALAEFDVDTEQFADYGTNALSASVGGHYNQFHVQVSNYVYMIGGAIDASDDSRSTGTHLQRYNLATKALANNWKTIPVQVYYAACLASDGQVLYVMGGARSSLNLNNVQRYSLTTNTWLAQRYMVQARREAACVYSASKGALYAIGGYKSGLNRDTVEWNTISRVNAGSSFSVLSNRLSTPLLDAFAVSIGTKVYVLGGYGCTASDTNNYWPVDTIHVIDTVTNTVTLSTERLAVSAGSTTGMVVSDFIYLFVGDTGGVNYYPSIQWQTTKDTDAPTKVPSKNPTPAPTSPANIVCGQSKTGDYNGQAITFSVVLAHDGDMTFDARPSPMPVSSLQNIAPPGVVDNGVGDGNAASNVMLLQDLTAGTYRFSLNLGSGTGQFSIATQCSSDVPTKTPTKDPTPGPTKTPTKIPTIDPSGAPTKTPTGGPTNVPTKVPSNNPTTPAPTLPGDITCGDSVTGDYAGIAVTISVNLPYDGAMTFDARGSSLAIPVSGLRRSTSPSVLDNGLGDEDGEAGVITMSNLNAGTYQYSVNLGTESGTFSVATQCQSDAPTKVPTKGPTNNPSLNPSQLPTFVPSAAPTDLPTRSPNLDPTVSPTFVPTDLPSMDPTFKPTAVPSSDPTTSPSLSPTENASGEANEDDDDQGEDKREIVETVDEEAAQTLFGFGFEDSELVVIGMTLFIVCVCCATSVYILRRIQRFKQQQVDAVAKLVAPGFAAGEGDERRDTQ